MNLSLKLNSLRYILSCIFVADVFNFVVYCLQALTVNGAEKSLAQTALFTRHPAMKGWPTGHGKVSCDTAYMSTKV